MAVFVAIHLPRLSLEVFRPRWSPRTENGCVVLDKDKVAIADAVAREAGVVMGMKRGGVVDAGARTRWSTTGSPLGSRTWCARSHWH